MIIIISVGVRKEGGVVFINLTIICLRACWSWWECVDAVVVEEEERYTK